MLPIDYDPQFERDLKRLKKRGYDLAKLQALLPIIAMEDARESLDILRIKHKAHRAKYNYRGYWECHVTGRGGDWVIIWKRTSRGIELARTGLHDDVF